MDSTHTIIANDDNSDSRGWLHSAHNVGSESTFNDGLKGNNMNPETISQPFHSFILSLSMILFSEVGDKTFLIAALMAMKHDRVTVFTAAFGALLVMTILSAILGHIVPTIIPQWLTHLGASILFFVFGLRLLREGLAMSSNEGVTTELQEVEHEIEKSGIWGHGPEISMDTLEMGLANGQRRNRGRFPTPPRSPSISPEPHILRHAQSTQSGTKQGFGNLLTLILSPVWVQTFVLTFLGEWGDRSQIATIAMATGQDYWWVIFGAMFGHAICTGIAVLGGRAVAGRVSLKLVTIGGACAFIIFGAIYLFETFYSY